MKIQTAAALLALVGTTLAGGAVLQGAATASPVTHTKHLLLHETASLNLDKRNAVGTDRIVDRGTGKVVGYDSFTGTFHPKSEAFTVQAGLSFRGGILLIRAHATGPAPRFQGKVIGGTGVYDGAAGTVTGHGGKGDRTFLTITWSR